MENKDNEVPKPANDNNDLQSYDYWFEVFKKNPHYQEPDMENWSPKEQKEHEEFLMEMAMSEVERNVFETPYVHNQFIWGHRSNMLDGEFYRINVNGENLAFINPVDSTKPLSSGNNAWLQYKVAESPGWKEECGIPLKLALNNGEIYASKYLKYRAWEADLAEVRKEIINLENKGKDYFDSTSDLLNYGCDSMDSGISKEVDSFEDDLDID